MPPTDPMAMTPVTDRTTKSDLAYEVLRRAIVTGAVAPDEALDEAALAREHGLGRTPLREALKRLAYEHFVVWPARRSPHVRGISALEHARLHELRLMLEAKSAALAAERATADHLAHLEQIVEEMTAHVESREIYELVRNDEQLHRAIADASDNRFLAEAVTQLNLGALRQWYGAMSRQDISGVAADHGSLVAAISARDPRRAAAGMTRHIHEYYDRQLALLRLPDDAEGTRREAGAEGS